MILQQHLYAISWLSSPRRQMFLIMPTTSPSSILLFLLFSGVSSSNVWFSHDTQFAMNTCSTFQDHKERLTLIAYCNSAWVKNKKTRTSLSGTMNCIFTLVCVDSKNAATSIYLLRPLSSPRYSSQLNVFMELLRCSKLTDSSFCTYPGETYTDITRTRNTRTMPCALHASG